MTASEPPPIPPGLSVGEPSETRETRDHGKTKLILNLVAASITVLLALWLTIADFAYPGNLIFQDSSSAPMAGFYLAALFFVLLVLAALPKRIIVAANLLILARIAMGWPISLLVDPSLACRITSISLLVLGLYHLASALRPSLLRLHLRPWLRLRHSVIAVVLWLGVGVISIPVLALGIVEAAKSLVGDYVQVDFSGISLVERVFEKDGQRVYLVGMMHIGDPSFYTTLNKRMRTPPADGKRIVLTEGVTDTRDILPAGFKSGETYTKLARALGLSVQPHSAPKRPKLGDNQRPKTETIAGVTFKNADIDVSALDQNHQQILVTVLELLDVDNMAQLLLVQPEDISGEEIEHLFMEGLLGKRNDALMTHFDGSAGYSEVYIPWGAAHLSDIETRLLARGFVKQDEIVRPIVRFRGKPSPATAVLPAAAKPTR